MTPREFITALTPAAQNNAARSGVPASVTIAQAALESGWGESELAWRARNLFGIKADDAWTGNTIALPTREYIGGQWVNVTARFRSYPDWQGSIDDHAAFLRKNPRYSSAFSAPDSEQFAERIAAAGYATDPDYASKLINLMRQYQLAALDESQPQLAAEPAAPASKPEPAAAPARTAQELPFEGGEGGSSHPRRSQPVEAPDAPQGNPAAPWPFPEVDMSTDTIATAAQAAATIATAVNPPLGALLQVAASLFPKIAGLLQSKDLSVSNRNTQIGAAVLDTIANAVGAQNRIDGLARVANDPAARERAQAALEPYFVMASAPEGTVEARKMLTSPIGNNWEAWRALGYGFLLGLVTLILIIGGGWMLREVLINPTTDQQLKGAIIGFLTGTALAAPILFLFGSSGQSRQKDQTIERLSR